MNRKEYLPAHSMRLVVTLIQKTDDGIQRKLQTNIPMNTDENTLKCKQVDSNCILKDNILCPRRVYARNSRMV